MAVDAKKLSSWAGGKGDAPPAGKGAPAPEPDAEEPELDEDEAAEGEEGGDEEMTEGGLKEYAPLMELMEQQAPAIEEAINASGVNLDALLAEDPLEQEDLQKVGEILVDEEVTTPELGGLMLALFDEITYEEAMDLAQHIVDEGYGTDADVLGGFMFHAKETFPAIHEALEQHQAEGAPEGNNPVAKLAAATAPEPEEGA